MSKIIKYKQRYNPKTGSRLCPLGYNKDYRKKNRNKLLKINRELYRTRVPKNVREKILERDNHECQICGQKTYLNLHHFNGNRKNNSYWNLLTLCPACHRSIHAGNF